MTQEAVFVCKALGVCVMNEYGCYRDTETVATEILEALDKVTSARRNAIILRLILGGE